MRNEGVEQPAEAAEKGDDGSGGSATQRPQQSQQQTGGGGGGASVSVPTSSNTDNIVDQLMKAANPLGSALA
jgi:hypothetical protein